MKIALLICLIFVTLSCAPRASAANDAGDGAAPGAPCVNVNSAALAELDAVKGVSAALAERIIKARPFGAPAELDAVKGVGRVLMTRLCVK